MMATPASSISVSLPGPGSAAFIGAGLVGIAAAYAAIHGGPAFVIAVGLGVVAAVLVYVGWWVEKHPPEVVRREWEIRHGSSLSRPYEPPPR